jgi:hypothetical protein
VFGKFNKSGLLSRKYFERVSLNSVNEKKIKYMQLRRDERLRIGKWETEYLKECPASNTSAM